MERQLTIKFIGKDGGLIQSASGAAGAMGALGKEVQKASQFVGAYVDAQGKLRNAQKEVIDATKLTQVEMVALRKELQATNQDLDLFEAQLTDSQAGLTGLAATTGVLGGAIGAVFAKGSKDFLAFSASLNKVGVLSGASEEELALLGDEIDRLGIITSKTPEDIAATAIALAQAGFSATETQAALEGVARSSEATGESMQVLGDITAKTIRTFSLTGADAGEVGDILVATANATNTTVSGIGESLSQSGAAAAGANQPLTDIAVAIGLLGDAGIQGGEAGTALVAALDGLKQSSASAETAIASLAGDEKLIKAFNLLNVEVRNSDGSLKSILTILPLLKQNLAGLSQGDQDLITKTLFGVEGGKGIQTLLNATDERVRQVTESVRNATGQSQAQGQALLEGAAGSLELLTGSLASATQKFGELAVTGLEPLIALASTVVNGFLALPAPLQTAVVATTGFVGALSGAIALLVTFEALNLRVTAGLALNQAATLGLTTAKQAQLAVITASTIANAVLNAELTKQNVQMALSAISTKATAIQMQLLAVANGTAATATTLLAGKLLVLAAQAALVTGAVLAVSQAFKRSEGAEFASSLDESVEALQKARGEADKTKESVSGLTAEYKKFFDNIRDKGPLEAVLIALSELTNSTGQFGNQLGIITSEQRGAQIAQLATAEAIAQLGGTVTETTDLLAKFGQVGKDARDLNPAELIEFTAAVAEQSKALQEEIKVLEASKGQSKELDQQLQNEIAIRESLIKSLEARVTAQGGDTAAVKAATAAAKDLGDVLDDLSSKYDRLEASSELTADRALADIAQQEAEGILSAAEAERKTLEIERGSLQGELDRNRALLNDLNAQRDNRTGEDRKKIDEEILKVQSKIAKGERSLAEERARQRRDENEEAARAAEEAADRQQQIAEAAAKKRADLLEQSQEDEKRIRAESFADTQRAESDRFSQSAQQAQQQFDDSQRTAEEAFDERQRTAEAAFAEEQRARDEGFAIKQQAADAAFEDKKRAAEAAFNAAERERSAAFDSQQRSAQLAFEQQKQAGQAAFDDQQSAAREAAEGRFAERRAEIERSLQLDQAESPAARKQLEEQFKAEDAAAQQREQAFAVLVAQEQAFAQQQEAEKAAFDEEQRAAQAAFEEEQRLQKATFDENQRLIQQKFEESQQILQEAYDKRKQEAEQLFEESKRLAEATFEAEQRSLETEFANQQREADRAFALEQQAQEQAFEQQKREAERAFNEEQRLLDRQNASQVQAILDAARPPATQSLRGGGVAEGGIVRVHADEFLIPPRGTRVISQAESRRLISQHLAGSLSRSPVMNGQAAALNTTAPDSGVPERLDALIAAVQAQQQVLQAGGNSYQIYGEADPTGAALRASREHLKMLVRMR